MSRLDEAQIRQSIEAIVKRDIDLAKSVIAAHDRVDSLQREIEEKAVVTIARRQPMRLICATSAVRCASATIWKRSATLPRTSQRK
jgi:phosphate uptake regulator